MAESNCDEQNTTSYVTFLGEKLNVYMVKRWQPHWHLVISTKSVRSVYLFLD